MVSPSARGDSLANPDRISSDLSQQWADQEPLIQMQKFRQEHAPMLESQRKSMLSFGARG